MIRDWDLWPIYLDQRWMTAESAKRFARMSRMIQKAIQEFGISAREASERFAAALHEPTDRR